MDKDILKAAVVLRHKLHRCAELSGQEKQTKATLIDFLRTHTSLERMIWVHGSMPCTRLL